MNAQRKNKSVAALFSVSAMALSLACGNATKISSLPPPNPANSAGTAAHNAAAAAADPGHPFACLSKSVCPQAALDYVYTGLADTSGHLTGTLGADVKWTFRAVDHNTLAADQSSSSRHTVLFLTDVPAGAQVTPAAGAKLDNTATVAWTPGAAAAGAINVIVRDYDRCVLSESEAACNKPSVMTPYDKTYGPVKYEVTLPADAIPAPTLGADNSSGTTQAGGSQSNGMANTSSATTSATSSTSSGGNGMPATCQKGIFGSILSGLSGGLLGNGPLGCLL